MWKCEVGKIVKLEVKYKNGKTGKEKNRTVRVING